MRWAGWLGVTLVVAAAAGTGGFLEGRDGMGRAFLERYWPKDVGVAAAEIPADDPILYYRAPDGSQAYSLGPKRDANGREFLPVRSNEEMGGAPPPLNASTQTSNTP